MLTWIFAILHLFCILSVSVTSSKSLLPTPGDETTEEEEKCNFCKQLRNKGASPFESLWALRGNIGGELPTPILEKTLLLKAENLKMAEAAFLEFCRTDCEKFFESGNKNEDTDFLRNIKKNLHFSSREEEEKLRELVRKEFQKSQADTINPPTGSSEPIHAQHTSHKFTISSKPQPQLFERSYNDNEPLSESSTSLTDLQNRNSAIAKPEVDASATTATTQTSTVTSTPTVSNPQVPASKDSTGTTTLPNITSAATATPTTSGTTTETTPPTTRGTTTETTPPTTRSTTTETTPPTTSLTTTKTKTVPAVEHANKFKADISNDYKNQMKELIAELENLNIHVDDELLNKMLMMISEFAECMMEVVLWDFELIFGLPPALMENLSKEQPAQFKKRNSFDALDPNGDILLGFDGDEAWKGDEDDEGPWNGFRDWRSSEVEDVSTPTTPVNALRNHLQWRMLIDKMKKSQEEEESEEKAFD